MSFKHRGQLKSLFEPTGSEPQLISPILPGTLKRTASSPLKNGGETNAGSSTFPGENPFSGANLLLVSGEDIDPSKKSCQSPELPCIAKREL